MQNKYVNRAKISEAKFRELVRFFSLDLTATQIAELTGLNRNTVNRYLKEIRKKITHYCISSSPIIIKKFPELERTNNSSFSILLRENDGNIYTEIAPVKSYIDQLEDDFLKDFIYTNFDILIDPNELKHHILAPRSAQLNNHRKKINRIENFWGNAKSRLVKFKGMHSSTFHYHMKECEFRFNNRDRNLYPLLLKILRKNPLF